MYKKLLLAALPVPMIIGMIACNQPQKQSSAEENTGTSTSDEQIIQTAKDAYVFGFPLVVMDVSRRQSLNPAINPLSTPENTIRNISVFPDASFRQVVRPNADTYYSSGWFNLEKEPVILSVPDTKGRYYMMPMLDAWTNVFASPGKRTTGTGAGNFLISGPGWSGSVPAGMQQIKSPTDMVWLVGRTQVNSKADGNKVVIPLQKQYKLTPLSAWGKPYTPPALVPDPAAPKGDPNEVVKNIPVDSFFNYLNKLMVINPPAAVDQPALDKFAAIGIGPGKAFDPGKFNAVVQDSIKNIPAAFFASSGNIFTGQQGAVNGWKLKTNLGSYGTDYQTRAEVALGGLGANLPQDAVYPGCTVDENGNQLTGANNYVLHFDKGQEPPVNAFWSLTVYGPDGYMIKNPINRNAIGDRSNLKQNADGSTDIYIQYKSPGKDKESNWLPAPEGEFNILMRLYWPKDEVINGTWKIPPVKKVK